MRNDSPSLSKYSPGVLSMLPLYYVGWADSVLSPSEVILIRNKVEDLNFFNSRRQRIAAKNGGNPASPPSHALFKEWISILQNAAQKLPQNSKHSLVQLGLEMAQRSAAKEGNSLWQNFQHS